MDDIFSILTCTECYVYIIYFSPIILKDKQHLVIQTSRKLLYIAQYNYNHVIYFRHDTVILYHVNVNMIYI
jgi:hypothetical protein